jgi:hypothetical protein
MQSNRFGRSNRETGGDGQRGEIEPRTGEIGSSWVDRAGEKGTRRAIGVKKERAKEVGRESGVEGEKGRERKAREGGGQGPN